MESKVAVNLIKTRFLVLSDTHGMAFTPENHPLQLENRTQHVDVAIHCGDLTEESKTAEFITTLELLKSLDAKLKLVIAGNHDFTLDVPIFKKKVAEAIPALRADEVSKEYGGYGEIRTLFEDARQSGIMFLDEGTHHFTLDNGASLTVYASPYTPSRGEGGFQYSPQEGHTFAIEPNTDVAITHGPPRGILDFTDAHQRAGCKDLLQQ
ncbi:uncharacterized protein E0L32_003717 [Thyridium curvatum]|uniref:Calcineurin-like phosphoesterase domain-containing protein n=1 Tax=Thyridium curvatum TaxID=1093900 RepID=A0A507B9Y0_9PEZI|nr:uncharacterized protein E0L32_003717 [Thyridium curvatum]TPX16423.1 hypothetical protein E0L32_003717 [Thyridium curvatum]